MMMRLLDAARAGVRTVVRGDYTVSLAEIQDALDGAAFVRVAQRMRTDPVGRRLLAERPAIDSGSVDFAALRALPERTLGHQLWWHLYSSDLLRDVHLLPSRYPLDPDATYAKQRWRETHDLRHVLTGLGPTMPDEVALQGFQYGQFRNAFGVVQMTFGPVLGWRLRSPVRTVLGLPAAIHAGAQAAFLANVHYEELFATPVGDVRRALGVRVLGRHYLPDD